MPAYQYIHVMKGLGNSYRRAGYSAFLTANEIFDRDGLRAGVESAVVPEAGR